MIIKTDTSAINNGYRIYQWSCDNCKWVIGKGIDKPVGYEREPKCCAQCCTDEHHQRTRVGLS